MVSLMILPVFIRFLPVSLKRFVALVLSLLMSGMVVMLLIFPVSILMIMLILVLTAGVLLILSR